jgi:hypothetical protein
MERSIRMKSKTVGAGSGVLISLFLIFILGMVHPLGAGSKIGAVLRIVTKDGTKVQGELLTVKGRTLLINSPDIVSGNSIALDEVRDLAIVGEKTKALSGFGIGLLAGAATGAIGGAIFANKSEPQIVPVVAVMAGVAGLGAIVGGLVGWAVGSGSYQDEPLIVASVYQLEPDALLKKLRAAAKDPEYR